MRKTSFSLSLQWSQRETAKRKNYSVNKFLLSKLSEETMSIGKLPRSYLSFWTLFLRIVSLFDSKASYLNANYKLQCDNAES